MAMIIIPPAVVRRGIGARRVVEARLRAARAFDPRTAIAFEAKAPGEYEGLEEAVGRGRIVRAVNGRYFLNPAAIPEPRFANWMAVLLLLLCAGSVIASVVMLMIFAAR